MNFERLEIDEDYGDTVLPLVLCRSGGGPYEDDAFVSGWRLGRIEATLSGPGISALAESMSVPVLAIFGGTDDAISPADVSDFERALTAARVDHEVITYPGAPHSFFDRRQQDFTDASDDAWHRVLEFIERHRG